MSNNQTNAVPQSQAASGNPQTGPKTAQGKKTASMNAQKAGIFTKGYLPSEDIAQKQEQYEALAEQWKAYDPTRQIILRSIEQAHLGIERLMQLEAQIHSGLMVSADIRSQFGKHAGLQAAMTMTLPAWFFTPAYHEEKDFALRISKVYYQAHQLCNGFTDLLAAQIATQFPDLYRYVLQGQKTSAQFSTVLGQTYRQNTITANLEKLIEQLESKYRHHLVWAEDSERYQLLIEGLRAQQIQVVMDMDKSTRYATNLQNRLLKGFQALQMLDQIQAKAASQVEPLTLTHSEESIVCLDIPVEQK